MSEVEVVAIDLSQKHANKLDFHWDKNEWQPGCSDVTVEPDGGIYKGQTTLNGDANGKGTSIWTDGESYKGDWLNDRKHGQGRTIYPSGNMHEGQYADGYKNGACTVTFANGDKHEGSCVNGKPHGIWKLTKASGKIGSNREYNNGVFVRYV